MNFYNYAIAWRSSIPVITLKRTIMRIQLVLLSLFVLILQLQANNLSAQRLTLNANRMSLENVLKEVTRQTSYDFLFNPKLLKENALPVTLNQTNMPLDEALVEIFKSQPNLSYTIDQKTVIIRPKRDETVDKVTLKLEEALQQAVRGKVTNEQGEPLPGITVTVKGTNIATKTDDNGNYQMNVPAGNNILLFTGIGFTPTESPI